MDHLVLGRSIALKLFDDLRFGLVEKIGLEEVEEEVEIRNVDLFDREQVIKAACRAVVEESIK